MPADPIIIDDGGSTRLKHNRSTAAAGEMDGLLTVLPNAAGVPQSSHSFPSPLGAFTALRIVFHGPAGRPTELPAGGGGFAVGPGDTILVISGDLTIQMDIMAGNTANLTLLGKLCGTCQPVEPLVEAKQTRRKRRYVVSNSPPIDLVKLNGATKFDRAATPSIYTTIHLS